MSAPRQSAQPLYLGAGQPYNQPPVGNPLTQFWRDQVVNPEYRAGNLNILLGVTTFVVGVIGVRSFGGLLVPGF